MRTGRIAGVGDQRVTSKAERSTWIEPPRPAAARAIHLSAVPPLQWWRRLPADAFTSARLDVLRRAIRGIHIMGEPTWRDAAQDDAAAAVGVALRIVKRAATPTPVVDLVMSAVLLATLAGDPAAAMVLTTMIKRKAAKAQIKGLLASWAARTRSVGLVAAAAKGKAVSVANRATVGA
jgi:hypothetical protein